MEGRDVNSKAAHIWSWTVRDFSCAAQRGQ